MPQRSSLENVKKKFVTKKETVRKFHWQRRALKKLEGLKGEDRQTEITQDE